MKRWLLILISALGLTGCGYNNFQRLVEQTKSAWSEELNPYQRRADLVPNIVATVKGEAALKNVLSRSFPTNLTAMLFSKDPKPTFAVQNEAAITAPPGG